MAEPTNDSRASDAPLGEAREADIARRKLLRMVAYAAPAIVGSLAVRKASAAPGNCSQFPFGAPRSADEEKQQEKPKGGLLTGPAQQGRKSDRPRREGGGLFPRD